MCGVFGFVAGPENRFGPNVDALCEIAIYNDARRGGHAWGVSWIDSQGRLRSHKQSGRIKPAVLGALVEDAVALIGHLRFTTQGTEKINANNHPHPCDGGWMVHNGVLPEYYSIKDSFSTQPLSDCDSEMLAIAWTDAPSNKPAERANWMLKTCQPERYAPLVVLGLWKSQLVAVRQGNPLSVYHNADGHYLSSLPVPGLVDLGDPKIVSDGSITTWTNGKTGWKRSFSKLEKRADVSRPLFQPSKSLPW